MPQYLISMTTSFLPATGSGKFSWYCSTSTDPCSKNATAFIYYYLVVRLCIDLRSCPNCSSSGGTGISIGSLSDSGFPVSFEIVSFFLFHIVELNSIMALVYFVISARSEEHTSELQSRQYLVCRLLLEKK